MSEFKEGDAVWVLGRLAQKPPDPRQWVVCFTDGSDVNYHKCSVSLKYIRKVDEKLNDMTACQTPLLAQIAGMLYAGNHDYSNNIDRAIKDAKVIIQAANEYGGEK